MGHSSFRFEIKNLYTKVRRSKMETLSKSLFTFFLCISSSSWYFNWQDNNDADMTSIWPLNPDIISECFNSIRFASKVWARSYYRRHSNCVSNCWFSCFNWEDNVSQSTNLAVKSLFFSCSNGITLHKTSAWLLNAVDGSEDCLGVIAKTPLVFARSSRVRHIRDIHSDVTSTEDTCADNELRRGVRNVSPVNGCIAPTICMNSLWCIKKWRRVANKCHEANTSLFLTFVNALAGVLHSVPFWSADAIFWHKEVYTRRNGSECETFSKTNLNFCCFLTHRTSNTNLVSDACSFPSTGPDQCLHLIMLSSSAPDHTC